MAEQLIQFFHGFYRSTIELQEKRDEIYIQLDRIQLCRVDIQASLDMIAVMKKKLKDNLEYRPKVLDAFFDVLKKQNPKISRNFDDHKKHLKEELKRRTEPHIRNLDNQIEQLKRDLKCFENCVRLADLMVHDAQDSHFEPHRREIHELVKHFADIPYLQGPVETHHLVLEDRKPYNFDNLYRSFELVGKQSKKIMRQVRALKCAEPPVLERNYTMPTGVFTLPTGGRGLGHTAFKGMALDRNDNFYVADYLDNQILVFDKNGQALRRIGDGSSLLHPCGVAVSKDNRIIVVDSSPTPLKVFDENGTFAFAFGAREKDQGLLKRPWGVHIDKTNRILVTDKWLHKILIFDMDGGLISAFGVEGLASHMLKTPRALTTDKDNNIVVVSETNRRVQIFDKDGLFLRAFWIDQRNKMRFKTSGTGVVVDENGHIIVTDETHCVFRVFSSEGVHLGVFGGSGSRPGYFNSVQAVVINSENKISFLDETNLTIQTYG